MNIKQLLNEKYEVTFDEFCEGKYDPDYCFICYKQICEPAYIIPGDEPAQMHKSCGELPTDIQHPLHPRHPLKIRSLERNLGDYICDGCRHFSVSLNYECRKCKFHLDFKCVLEYEGQALVEKVEAFTNYHRHKLQLLHASISLLALEHFNMYFFRCCSCLEPLQDSFYACVRCLFFIHQSCLDTIPEQVESSFHPQHPLFPRITTSGYKGCRGCGERVEGIELRCQRCEYSFHVSCGKHTTPSIRLVVHEHNLFYVCHSPRRTGRCAECGERCEGARYRCVQCNHNFHVECILPPELTHECHDHPLTLTNSVVPKCNPNEFRCDICEKEGDLKHHVYHCEECYYIAHIECVLSEEDPSLEMESTDDSEQQIKEVQEDGLGFESGMYEPETSESEESSDEEQKNDELNKKIAKVKKQIEGLTFELQRLEFLKRQRELSQSSK
ncbi:hypothetical protein JRO89_XS03G0310800 [Xanthoceras sorbifolium]|uniref:DC1 domain-containing protein n=1 Tax=Xanthoceras sorbifolium TaxID=99658 RepID=A0ABQ8ID23_9ROSI|nr:hypothetical protein JRO89_XS03G0310800 [Xanthoceras sorbifolium]